MASLIAFSDIEELSQQNAGVNGTGNKSGHESADYHYSQSSLDFKLSTHQDEVQTEQFSDIVSPAELKLPLDSDEDPDSAASSL